MTTTTLPKVLIIEDCPIQQDWAKKQLEGLAEVHVWGARDIIGTRRPEVQYVLTDMELPSCGMFDPEWCSDPPFMGEGIQEAVEVIRKIKEKKLLGGALVSNYEHHCNTDFSEEGMRFQWIVEVAVKAVKLAAENLNFITSFDRNLSIVEVLVDGKVLRGCNAQDYIAEKHGISIGEANKIIGQGKEAVILKPWKEVFLSLLEGQKK